eukprot:9746201-Prorocentrum_lima.AAC.1
MAVEECNDFADVLVESDSTGPGLLSLVCEQVSSLRPPTWMDAAEGLRSCRQSLPQCDIPL